MKLKAKLARSIYLNEKNYGAREFLELLYSNDTLVWAKKLHHGNILTQPALTCTKSAVETRKKYSICSKLLDAGTASLT